MVGKTSLRATGNMRLDVNTTLGPFQKFIEPGLLHWLA